ncbi:bifunctional D-glycero-beta-D-manno-heptose-7-phosphate kinase/D-glycero-beta-D-manno-heptose 1-phosphate adenylyltransferase HldE [Alloacidobacterium dinghuense]|uniref:Bifunctional protein HldE n=1 Tax=Alloacidobacterium dinghuense TaxID=2763107 RepID=A0A7G8BGA0_9BACT|nr:bifunctional D-glycero-beta-D-manno-heptose-7-phosphate kinase/D-glycero-beta-D-manno-heptose 1-phosphate adenylyltransferase HldE [Alloacidobacterium dinghuense]QNI31570.1 bifunctional D-glycero-beta-D-manno-heptose-7-phosphate kinase/D-glycero-beta-D-manno-heptose 1-phosphate adenylyltransferase HldE [Alloacidobacterium dinghuense]
MIQNLHEVIQLIEDNWRKTQVLVVGDLMLDRYIWGDVKRISPEAPVPIVHATLSTDRPGGAANVAMNIVGLGAKVAVLGFCGNDSEGVLLEKHLRDAGIQAEMTSVMNRPTTSKLRILCGQQQLLRLDTERCEAYPGDAYAALVKQIECAITSADAVILSDYGKGVLTEEVCQWVILAARRQGIPVLVDPKRPSFARYHGATTICPNLTELSVAVGISSDDVEALLQAGQNLVGQLDLDCLVPTLSEKGIAVLRQQSKFVAPAVARQVFDVSGAGDTVIATLALATANGLEMETAAQVANIAAGIVIGKVGTVPVNRDELLAALKPEIELRAMEKVLTLDQLKIHVSAWRSARETVVFTNGCFDLLHIGHVALLEEARREGDRLIVAINSDASVRGLKGSSRPIVGEQERARILAAFAVVDAVIAFDDPTPLRLIDAIRPDVIVKGGDYREEAVVGAEEVRSWGGRVKIVPTVEGFSTTKLIDRATTGLTDESMKSKDSFELTTQGTSAR